MSAGALRARTLAAFFAVGLAIVGMRRATADERPELSVTVPRGAAPEAVARAVDEALLVEVGLGLGWRTDPVVVDRLLRDLRFVEASGDDVALLARAEATDLVRRDPVVRARLVERATRVLSQADVPDDAALEAYRVAHAERFRRPPMVTFQHALVDAGGAPDLVLGPHPTRSETALARALGADAAHAIVTAPAGPDAPWITIATPLGAHRVKVEAIVPGAVPPLAEIRAEVLGAWREEARKTALQAGIERLRAGTRLAISEVDGGRP